MPAAVERCVKPQRENLVRQAEGDDASAHRQHVGVVVRAREARGVEVVAERGANARHFIGGHLLALPAAADDDAAIGVTGGDGASDRETKRRIVDRGFAVGAVIVDRVAETDERLFEMFLQREAGMVGANRNPHDTRFYYTLSALERAPMSRMPKDDAAPAAVISTRGEERLRSGHPWIYRADVVDARAGAGDVVVVKDRHGRPLGRALYSDRSQIVLRMIEYGRQIDESWLRRRIESAIAFRQA